MATQPIAFPNPVHRAAYEGDLNTLQKIVAEAPESLELPDEHGRRPLFLATLQNRRDCIQWLTEAGADLDATEESGLAPIHIATKNNLVPVVRLFHEKGQSLEHMTKYGETPLFLAARRGHLELLEYFVEAGVDINATNHGRWNALMVICKKAADFHPDNIDKPAKTESQRLALEVETEERKKLYKNMIRFGKELIKQGLNLEHTNDKGGTALIVAARFGITDVVKALLRKKVNPDLQDNVEYTALHYAARYNNLQVAKALVQRGANVNPSDSYGFTPLFEAAENGHLRLLKLLHKNGAAIDIRLHQSFQDFPAGSSPLDIANIMGRKNIIRYLGKIA